MLTSNFNFITLKSMASIALMTVGVSGHQFNAKQFQQEIRNKCINKTKEAIEVRIDSVMVQGVLLEQKFLKDSKDDHPDSRLRLTDERIVRIKEIINDSKSKIKNSLQDVKKDLKTYLDESKVKYLKYYNFSPESVTEDRFNNPDKKVMLGLIEKQRARTYDYINTKLHTYVQEKYNTIKAVEKELYQKKKESILNQIQTFENGAFKNLITGDINKLVQYYKNTSPSEIRSEFYRKRDADKSSKQLLLLFEHLRQEKQVFEKQLKVLKFAKEKFEYDDNFMQNIGMNDNQYNAEFYVPIMEVIKSLNLKISTYGSDIEEALKKCVDLIGKHNDTTRDSLEKVYKDLQANDDEVRKVFDDYKKVVENDLRLIKNQLSSSGISSESSSSESDMTDRLPTACDNLENLKKDLNNLNRQLQRRVSSGSAESHIDEDTYDFISMKLKEKISNIETEQGYLRKFFPTIDKVAKFDRLIETMEETLKTQKCTINHSSYDFRAKNWVDVLDQYRGEENSAVKVILKDLKVSISIDDLISTIPSTTKTSEYYTDLKELLRDVFPDQLNNLAYTLYEKKRQLTTKFKNLEHEIKMPGFNIERDFHNTVNAKNELERKIDNYIKYDIVQVSNNIQQSKAVIDVITTIRKRVLEFKKERYEAINSNMDKLRTDLETLKQISKSKLGIFGMVPCGGSSAKKQQVYDLLNVIESSKNGIHHSIKFALDEIRDQIEQYANSHENEFKVLVGLSSESDKDLKATFVQSIKELKSDMEKWDSELKEISNFIDKKRGKSTRSNPIGKFYKRVSQIPLLEKLPKLK